MSILEYLVKATTRHPVVTILIVLGITFLALIPASNFAVDTSPEGWLESDDPDIARAEEVREQFGSQGLVTVVIDSSDSEASTAEAYVESLAESLKQDGRFKNIRYKQDLSFAGEKGILYLPKEQIAMLSHPSITLETVNSMLEELNNPKYIVSENGKIYLINLGISTTIRDARERESLFDYLGDLITETKKEKGDYEELDVGFTGGMMVIDYEGDKMVFEDFFRTGFITLILILILLFISFRSLSIPLLSFIPLLTGIVWTSGLIFLIYDSLNIMAIMFAVLILGLGVDYCIHLLTRFVDEMNEHNDLTLAFRHTFVHTGRVVILGCLTTVTALLSFYFAKTTALHQLGVVGAMGLLLTLVAVLVLLPALVALRLKFGKFKVNRARFNVLRAIGSQVERFAPIVVVFLVILLIVFGIRAPNAKVNENMWELMPTEIETYKQLEKVKENFGYNPDSLSCVVESESELEERVQEFQSKEGLLGVESILDYLPADQEEKLELIQQTITVHPEFAAVPWINVSPMGWSDLPSDIRRAWVSEEGQFLIKITPAGDLYDKSYQGRLLSELREVDPDVTAQALIWTKLLDTVTTDMIHTSLIASGIIFSIVYIGTRRRNPIYALLSMVPVTFGTLGLLGTYQWFGANLNAFSIGMMPLIIGIGIDDGIHIIHRYLEEGKGSLPRVTQLTGKAIFLTTATTCLAFSSLLFSGHPSLKFVSLIPIIGISLCFFGAIIFMPALLRIIVDRGLRKNRKKDILE